MKLDSVETLITKNLNPGCGGKYFIFVKVQTRCGIVGFGEVYSAAIHPRVMIEVIKDMFSRYMFNENPFNIELMFRKVYSSGFSQRPDPTVISAFSGMEIACWDIIGKACEKPIWQLLGGKMRNKLRSYSYLYPSEGQNEKHFYESVDQSTEAAVRLVEMGFTAVKFDPAGPYTIHGGHQPLMHDLDLSNKFCKSIRKSIGNRADILFGTHGQFTPSGAIRLSRKIEKYDPLWFEEPVPPDNPSNMALVSRSTRIPIATGERLTTKNEFAIILKSGAASILQPALGRVGGLWEAKKIAAIAEVFGAQVAPHLYAGPIEWAANIQLSLTLPNFLLLETIGIGDGFHSDLLTKKILWEDGYVSEPQGPGLGVDLNEDFARKHPFLGHELHLEMSSTERVPHGNKFESE